MSLEPQKGCKGRTETKAVCQSLCDVQSWPSVSSGVGMLLSVVVSLLPQEIFQVSFALVDALGSMEVALDGSVLYQNGLIAEDLTSQQGSKPSVATDLTLFLKS